MPDFSQEFWRSNFSPKIFYISQRPIQLRKEFGMQGKQRKGCTSVPLLITLVKSIAVLLSVTFFCLYSALLLQCIHTSKEKWCYCTPNNILFLFNPKKFPLIHKACRWDMKYLRYFHPFVLSFVWWVNMVEIKKVSLQK